ncbi:regulator of G-protein signaling 20-like isoform X1 [Coregonus clupeaformis]|uniref:regulator of G-protein signaling 20-like isoform X1 n=1 Tax=Coregonus clupeaformis TaxID=59861 RepID=UPI001BE0CB1A|nr:regulator of G-protein signaling 20-like isoform X1 [Coregonus clupeaformis]
MQSSRIRDMCTCHHCCSQFGTINMISICYPPHQLTIAENPTLYIQYIFYFVFSLFFSLTVMKEDERIQRSIYERIEGIANCDDSPKPTLEDATTWTMSFERLMKSPAGRGCFQQFLRTEFSEENIRFWLACEDLKKETNKTVVQEKVRQIYEDFISILSPKEVSLDSRVRDVINKNMLEPTSHTFEDAQQQIYTLMQRDSYPRYMNSTAYADLLQNLEEPPPATEP